MRMFHSLWVLAAIIALIAAFALVGACDDDDDDNDDAGDDDGDDDATDDDATDDDATDDDATDDDATDDDVTDDDVTDDDVVDDDDTTGDDDDDDDDDFTNQHQILINGDFETGLIDPWVGEWGGGIVYSSDEVNPHDGDYSVWLGGRHDGTEWIGQLVQTPAALGAAQFRFWHKTSRVGTPDEGGLTVRLKDELNLQVLAVLFEYPFTEDNYTALGSQWEEVVVDLTGDQIDAIAGQKVVVHFEQECYGGGFIANINDYIDDVTFTLAW